MTNSKKNTKRKGKRGGNNTPLYLEDDISLNNGNLLSLEDLNINNTNTNTNTTNLTSSPLSSIINENDNENTSGFISQGSLHLSDLNTTTT